jgi:hypothetical protein
MTRSHFTLNLKANDKEEDGHQDVIDNLECGELEVEDPTAHFKSRIQKIKVEIAQWTIGDT